jgi:hypothetical protein
MKHFLRQMAELLALLLASTAVLHGIPFPACI